MGRKTRQKPRRPSWLWPSLLFILAAFCILALPLIVRRDILDVSLMPRLLALLVFLAIYSLLLASPRVFREMDVGVLKRPVFAAYAAYFLITVISLAFALNLSAGWFDAFKTFAILVLMACISLVLVKTPDWQVHLPKYFILGGILISAIGFFEMVRELGFGFHPRYQINTVKGLMSNVNLYASSLMLMVPWALIGLVIMRGYWRVVSGISLGSLVFMIFLLQTRAAYAGLLAGLSGAAILALVYYRSFSISRKLRIRVGLAVLAVLMGLTTLVLTAGEDNIYASRFRSIFSGAENQNRLMIWEITVKMIADNPLTGVGAGNFTIRAPEYYAGHDFSEGPTNILRPHNDPLWVFSEKGVAGFLSFMAFFVLAAAYIRKIMRSNASKDSKVLALFLAMGLISYFVNALFDFPLERINHQVHLVFLVAATTVIMHQTTLLPRTAPPGKLRVVLLPVVLVLLAGIWYSIDAIRQEKYMGRARMEESRQNWSGMLQASRLAQTPWKNLDPLGTPVAYHEGRALYQLGNLPDAITAIERAHTHNPNRRFILRTLGIMYFSQGDYQKSIDRFSSALAFFPEDADLLTNLGRVYIRLEDFPAALEVLERIPEDLQTGEIRSLTGYVRQMLLQQRLRSTAPSGN
jgi:O-antigen ligase